MRRPHERDLAVNLQAHILSILPAPQREKFPAQLAAVADACQTAGEDYPKKPQ